MDKTEVAPSKGEGLYEFSQGHTKAAPLRSNARTTLLRSGVVLLALAFVLFRYRETLEGQYRTSIGGSEDRIGIGSKKPPNIVFIMTDDQDYRLGSLDFMDTVQKRIIGEGVKFENHFGTVALCCPGRTTLFRGQAAHNTNITHVGGVGGGYVKFRALGEWKSYLPHWLRQAGYTTAYFGKFLNGYGLHNYQTVPEGWDWTGILTGPYIYKFLHAVISENGNHPVYYEGWHQTDVLRLKALDRLEKMIAQDKPFFLEVAPASPHVSGGGWPTIPAERHEYLFPGAQAPRVPNWNPSDEYTEQKIAWLQRLPLMNDSVIEVTDLAYRKRAQALQSVDELVSDVIDMLEENGILDETYVIYTTDNGFHIGNHRLTGGKGQAYREDTNLPLAVRGPGIPAGAISHIAQSHIDIAPTLLDIAQLPRERWPPFFDGRSLLSEWKTLKAPNDDISRDVINVEFWGGTTAPASQYTRHWQRNSYKSLRVASEEQGYLFTRWCFNNATELYDTTADPYELVNLAIDPNDKTQRLINRLAGLLLVTKSCGRDTCRKPWEVLQGYYEGNSTFKNLKEALHPRYDDFFASLPHFGFKSCMHVQDESNEGPYMPSSSQSLGREFREWNPEFDGNVMWETNYTSIVIEEKPEGAGSWAQRFGSYEDLMRDARPLTREEIGWPNVRCDVHNDWCDTLYDDE